MIHFKRKLPPYPNIRIINSFQYVSRDCYDKLRLAFEEAIDGKDKCPFCTRKLIRSKIWKYCLCESGYRVNEGTEGQEA